VLTLAPAYRFTALEGELAALEQRREQEVAALEAEKKAIAQQAEVLAAELAAARAGEEPGRKNTQELGDGAVQAQANSQQSEAAVMAEICSLMVETEDCMQALGPGISDSLSSALASAMDSAAVSLTSRVLAEALRDTLLEDEVQTPLPPWIDVRSCATCSRAARACLRFLTNEMQRRSIVFVMQSCNERRENLKAS
jgi:hypothetical protein